MKTNIQTPEQTFFGRLRISDYAALLVLILILVEFFSPLIFDGRVFFSRDFTLITYPVRSFLSQIYHQGSIPLWSESVVHGAPFMEAFHTGVFYPPSLMFIIQDVTLALNLFYLLHFVILAWSVFLLGRSWGMSPVSSLCSSVTAMLSGFFLGSTLLSNFFLAAIWLPSVFYCFQNYLYKRRVRDFLGAVFFLTCQVLAACPEICIMTVLVIFFYFSIPISGKRSLKECIHPAFSLLGVSLLSIGLSALQLFPTFKMLEHSVRSGGLSFDTHTLWSMKWESLPYILLPQDFSDHLTDNQTPFQFIESFYMGTFAVLFLFVGMIFLKNKPIRFWLLVFFWGIFFALGNRNPLYQYFYDWIPLMHLFRYPEKYYYISAFAMVFLTGLGIEAIARETLFKKLNFKFVCGIILLMFAVVSLTALNSSELEPYFSFIMLLVFGLLYLTFYFGKVGPEKFKILLLILIFFDLTSHCYRIIPMINKEYFEREPILVKEIKKDVEPSRVYSGRLEGKPNKFVNTNGPSYFSRTLALKEYMYPFMGMIHGVEHPDSLPSIAVELKDHWLWRTLLVRGDPEKRRRILARSNVKYWVDVDSPTQYFHGYPMIFPDRLKTIDGALPRAFLVNKVRKGIEPHLLNTYYSEFFDPLEEVLLSEQVEWKVEENFNGSVESLKYSPNHVSINTTQNGEGFLVLLDSYFPGWTVKVDGKEEKILRANHFFRAVKLGPGQHTLEFDYFPDSFRVGLLISFISFLILILSAIVVRVQRSHLKPEPNTSL
ncbi:MAG: YfhO family protein [Nitrospinales bacterium]